MVANFAVGYDNVDVAACRERGVVVTNTPDVLTNATAELAVALMLAAARRLGEAERIVRAGRWAGWEPKQLLGRELSGAVVGIVGLGRIGTRVAELLRGFEVELLYAARSPPSRSRAEPRSGALDARRPAGALRLRHAPRPALAADASSDRRARARADEAGSDPREHLPRRAGGRGGAGRGDPRRAACRRRARRLRAGAAGPRRARSSWSGSCSRRTSARPPPRPATAMAKLVAENVIAVLEGRAPLTPVDPG